MAEFYDDRYCGDEIEALSRHVELSAVDTKDAALSSGAQQSQSGGSVSMAELRDHCAAVYSKRHRAHLTREMVLANKRPCKA